MKKVLALMLALCAVLCLCVSAMASGEPSAEPSGEASVAGIYTYTEVNAYSLEILWTLELTEDGAYALTEENMVAGVVTYTGTYTANGNVVTCGPMAEIGPPVYDWSNPAGFVVTVSGDGFVPGAQAASAEAASLSDGNVKSVEEAFIDYIYEFLLAELEVNSNMTMEQIENDYMPLIAAGDYVTVPAELLWNGMLVNGVAMTFEEFAAQYVPASPAGGDTSKEAYAAYLKEYVDACPAVADEHLPDFYALIDAEDYTTMPADMMFNAEWWGFAAMTYDEFVAAGGVYEIPAFDPGLTAD